MNSTTSLADSAEHADARAGFLPARVVHLHASRFCNLSCRHCYSSSGPHRSEELDPSTVLTALSLLRQEGYEVLSLSGGEPLLYRGIEDVIREAVALGYQISLVSNGAPINERWINLIAEYVHLTAISLDGGPDTHVYLRNHKRAFEWADQATDRLSRAGASFGIAYCVSAASLPDMPWVVEWAEKKGASLVQFHPFAPIGRGKHLADELSLSDTDKARAFTVATLLTEEDGPEIHIDLASVEAVRTRKSDYAVLNHTSSEDVPLSELINPLIIDEKGLALPLSYGVHSDFAIGRAGNKFGETIERYKEEGWRDIQSLLKSAFSQLDSTNGYFVDWFYHLVETSIRIRTETPTS